MAKTKGKKTHTAAIPLQQKASFKWFGLAAILIITFFVYWPSLDNELTNWDDQEYIIHNKDLRNSTIHYHFSERPHVMGNFHPLTMLSLSWDYKSAFDEKTGKIDPVPFHRTNLIFHLLNTILVVVLVWLLARNNFVAALCGFVFAMHPLHVESVAWAAERKDVLYSFFYLVALITYIFYLRKNNYAFFALTLLFFLFGLFSKAVTVSLPLMLFAIDFWEKRKWTGKVFIEKLPFLAIAVYFGLRAIKAQGEFEAIQGNDIYSLTDRILFASYGTMMYIVKFLAPHNLSCFYSFPVKAGAGFGAVYYMSLVFALALGVLAWWQRKNISLLFGLAFFFISVALVLQLLPVGGAVMADRYSYLPYIGLTFIAGYYLKDLILPGSNKKYLVFSVLVLWGIFLTWQTRERLNVWKNSIALWTDAEKKDKTSPKIYNNFGDAYGLSGDQATAIKYLNESLRLKPDYPDAYYNRGLAYFYMKKYQEALDDYTMAIKFNPGLEQAWHNRAGTYFTLGMYKEALTDALKAQELGYPVDPKFIEVLKEQVQKQKQ